MGGYRYSIKQILSGSEPLRASCISVIMKLNEKVLLYKEVGGECCDKPRSWFGIAASQ